MVAGARQAALTISLLIDYNCHTQPCVGFTESDPKGENIQWAAVAWRNWVQLLSCRIASLKTIQCGVHIHWLATLFGTQRLHLRHFSAALTNFDIVVTFPVLQALNAHGRNGTEGVEGSPRSSRCSTFKVELAYYELLNTSGERRSGSVWCLLSKGSSSVNCLASSLLPASPINNTPGHCAAKSHH